jgi:hypothetical protein
MPTVSFYRFDPGIRLGFNSGPNPTIVSYNATSSLVRFGNKNIYIYFKKRSSLLLRWHCS